MTLKPWVMTVIDVIAFNDVAIRMQPMRDERNFLHHDLINEIADVHPNPIALYEAYSERFKFYSGDADTLEYGDDRKRRLLRRATA